MAEHLATLPDLIDALLYESIRLTAEHGPDDPCAADAASSMRRLATAAALIHQRDTVNA